MVHFIPHCKKHIRRGRSCSTLAHNSARPFLFHCIVFAPGTHPKELDLYTKTLPAQKTTFAGRVLISE